VSLIFFGLDGEMSAPNLSDGGRLIQIGVAAGEPEGRDHSLFASLINPGPGYTWSMRAEGIHGFRKDEVEAAPVAPEVDNALFSWLLDRGAEEGKRGNIIPIGFNVGAFDMPHVAEVLPLTYSLFSRRTVDLNALCFTLDGSEYNNNPVSWSGWKRLAKNFAERTIHEQGFPGAEHDAGYDALIHLYGWRFLRAACHGSPLLLPHTPVPAPETQLLSLQILEVFGADDGASSLGVHPEVLRGWASGGRATRPGIVQDMQSLLEKA